MTGFEKTVRRVTRGSLSHGHGPDSGRPLVVELQQGDLIEFRPKGTRQRAVMSVFDLYSFALRSLAAAAAREKKLKRKGIR